MADKKERICFVCRTLQPATQLLRVARIEGKYAVDTQGNANGRGCYVCKTAACVEKATKTRALNKSFKAKVPDEIYELLAKYVTQSYTDK